MKITKASLLFILAGATNSDGVAATTCISPDAAATTRFTVSTGPFCCGYNTGHSAVELGPGGSWQAFLGRIRNDDATDSQLTYADDGTLKYTLTFDAAENQGSNNSLNKFSFGTFDSLIETSPGIFEATFITTIAAPNANRRGVITFEEDCTAEELTAGLLTEPSGLDYRLVVSGACFSCPPPPTCSSIVPGSPTELSEVLGANIGVKVTYDGKVPAINTEEGSYNMMVAENFSNKLIFIDQKEGILYHFVPGQGIFNDNKVKEIFNVNTDLPNGVDVDGINFPFFPFAGGLKAIHNVAPGSDNSMIIVFTSTTVPPEYESDALPLPEEQEYNFGDYGDCTDAAFNGASCAPPFPYSTQPLCCYGQKVYKLFYKYKVNGNSGTLNLNTAELFFALEMHNTLGHDGGAMLTLDDGRVLFSVGDCLPFGLNGLFASQDMSSHCGKMLLLDPSTPGSYEVVASGIRNSQQMNLKDGNVVFMDIGGVSSEEVNSIPLDDLLNTDAIDNFGWGMVQGETFNGENFGREGTFKVGRGQILSFGPFPPCLADQDEEDGEGFIAPLMQFGRGPGVDLYGITSFGISDVSFDKIKLAASEFQTGTMIVAVDDLDAEAPLPTYFVKLYKEDNGELVELADGFNTLVADSLGIDDGESIRGDSRLFEYPDGTVGVFIERTGEFYKLTEIEID